MTAGAGRLLAVAAIILFLFIGIPVVQQAYWDSSTDSQDRVEFNDSMTPTNGAVESLANSNTGGAVYAPQQDINVTQNGTTFIAEGNWSWIRSNGTVQIAQASGFCTTDSAFVEGYYTRPSTEQNLTKEIGTLPTSGFGSSWMLIAGVLLVLLALGIAANTK